MTSLLERRITGEWELLRRLAAQNPERLTDISADDLVFELTLRHTPALALGGDEQILLSDHRVRIVYPRFFPAAPLELYLVQPVQHPNIHPNTGFVCLWGRHRTTHTVEHALHKLVAILGWRLSNGDAVHVMQPEAFRRMQDEGSRIAATLATPPLKGITHEPFSAVSPMAMTGRPSRPRLS